MNKQIKNKKIGFPNNFLWGASTSAFQVEGAYATDGKGLTIQDTKPKYSSNICDFTIASDHYHHFKEDIALMAEMGFKSYRFSISWARIFPDASGIVNQKGIAFYTKLFDELKKHHIEPIVTIYHFDLPEWLNQIGGWLNRQTISAFVTYSKVLFENFGKYVTYWLTINEQNMMALAKKFLTPVDSNLSDTELHRQAIQENHYMFLASAQVTTLCHTLFKNSKIGPAPNISPVYPATCHPNDIFASQNMDLIRNWYYLDVAVHGVYPPQIIKYFQDQNLMFEYQDEDFEILKNGCADIIAFNYYSSLTVKAYEPAKSGEQDQQKFLTMVDIATSVDNPNLEKTEYGWPIDPQGLHVTIRAMYERYRLPMIITENGLGAHDVLTAEGKIHDQYRIDYLKKHIMVIKAVVEEGLPLFGYNPWSAIDLVSTHEGIGKRYGLIYVNRSEDDIMDLKRYRKDSFYWYQKVISSNGEEL